MPAGQRRTRAGGYHLTVSSMTTPTDVLLALVQRAGPNDAVPYVDPHFPDRPLRLWSARPRDYRPDMPVVFAFHGAGRNANDYRDYWLPVVDACGVLVIAPEYRADVFPGLRWFNYGNLQDDDGAALPREQSTYAIVPRLFDACRAAGLTTRPGYGMFGHSAGGQYVQRAVSAGFTRNVAVAIAANAGTYAMPDLEIGFPYGLGDVGIDADAFAQLLAFPLTVMAGTLDIDAGDPTFPKEPPAMLQGPTRYARAHRYYDTAQAVAASRDCAFGWSMVDVVDVGHDGLRITAAAAGIVKKQFGV